MKSKEQKRVEAESRQKNYDALSRGEKEVLFSERPGDSAKERVRLGMISASESRLLDYIGDHI